MLALTLLVRDEADTIEPNLEHHFAADVDFAIVTDHLSVDDTPRILERYARTGRVYVHRQTDEPYYQARWVTAMARQAYAMGATWVVNADADEFWWAANSGGSLKEALAAQPSEIDVVVAHRSDFPPVENADAPFWKGQVYREVESRNILGQPLPAKVAHRARPDIEVAQGNHSVSAPGLGAIVDDRSIEILHFPLRSYEQFERKIVNGGRAYEASDLPAGMGNTWRTAYGLWREGRLREVYDKHVLAAGARDAKLAAGEIVEDRRLADALRSIAAVKWAGR